MTFEGVKKTPPTEILKDLWLLLYVHLHSELGYIYFHPGVSFYMSNSSWVSEQETIFKATNYEIAIISPANTDVQP